MEMESAGVGRRFRFKLPNNLAKFGVVLKDTEGFLRLLIDIKVRIAFKNLTDLFCTFNSIGNVIAKRAFGLIGGPRNEIASDSDEDTVWLDDAL